MKKLFLAAALGVAGFVSAAETKEVKSETQKEEITTQSAEVIKKVRLTVVTTCGQTFSEVLDVPDDFTDADYVGVASIVNVMTCGETADGWDVSHP